MSSAILFNEDDFWIFSDMTRPSYKGEYSLCSLCIEYLACYTVVLSTCSADRGRLIVVLSDEFILLDSFLLDFKLDAILRPTRVAAKTPVAIPMAK